MSSVDPEPSPPNHRFTPEGRGLDFWLWELVCDDMERRTKASQVLDAMRFYAPPGSGGSGETTQKSWNEYGDEIRRVLASPDFETARFIRRVASFVLEARDKRMVLFHSRQTDLAPRRKRAGRLIGRIVTEQKRPSTSPARQETLNRRMRTLLCARSTDVDPKALIEKKLTAQELTALILFPEFEHFVLLVPDTVREMLNDTHRLSMIHPLLEKLGPRAIEFADDMIHQMNTAPNVFSPKTLAAVIVDDRARIAEVCAALIRDDNTAISVCSTLYYLGESAREADPKLVETLLNLATSPSPVRMSAVQALGTVTRGTSIAVDSLLQCTRDPDVWMRGTAITALGDLARDPDKFIPRLAECFDDYEEPNPDLMYESRHSRVTSALAQFGPAAVPAVPTLLAHLHDEEGLDRGVAKALAAIGPAAIDALPLLEQFAAATGYSPEDYENDYDDLVIAIQKIRGLA